MLGWGEGGICHHFKVNSLAMGQEIFLALSVLSVLLSVRSDDHGLQVLYELSVRIQNQGIVKIPMVCEQQRGSSQSWHLSPKSISISMWVR